MLSVNKLGHEYDLEGQVSVAPWGKKNGVRKKESLIDFHPVLISNV